MLKQRYDIVGNPLNICIDINNCFNFVSVSLNAIFFMYLMSYEQFPTEE